MRTYVCYFAQSQGICTKETLTTTNWRPYSLITLSPSLCEEQKGGRDAAIVMQMIAWLLFVNEGNPSPYHKQEEREREREKAFCLLSGSYKPKLDPGVVKQDKQSHQQLWSSKASKFLALWYVNWHRSYLYVQSDKLSLF